MNLFRLISWPYARKHLLRSLLTAAGIVLGVAVFVGMHTANQSVLQAFNRTVDRIAGKAQLQVTAGEIGFDEEVLERVQALAEVRVAEPVIEAVIGTGVKGQGSLLMLAVDMTGDRSLRDYDLDGDEVIDDPLVFLAQPDSLIVTRDFAARNGLTVNSKLAMRTMDGEKRFTIRGLLRPGGLSAAFGGNLAIMDVYAAQKIFGRGRKFDRIDLALKEGVTLEQGQAAIRHALGPGFDVDPPSGRGQHFESLMRIYANSVNISSVFALVVGMFIIYNSFAIAVTQRRSEIGVLRALGATRRQIRSLFLGESALAGIAGSLVGIGLGLVAARGLAASTSQVMESILGIAQNADEVSAEPRLLITAFAVGILTSMLAAWIPARNAAGLDPVRALQKGRYQVLTAGENRWRRRLGFISMVASILFLWLGFHSAWFYAGFFSMIGAALLFTPSLALWMARAVRRPLGWMRPVEGSLAADSLIQAPRRTSATVAGLMLSLSMVIGLGGMAKASMDSIQDWVRTTLNPDLFVTTSETISAHTFHFPHFMGPELEQVPGVAEVQPVRTIRINVGGSPVMLIALPAASVGRRASERRVTAGDYAEMHRRAAAGQALIVSENFAELQKYKLGDTLMLPSATGTVRLPIAGILRDYSNQLGSIFVDLSVYRQRWKDDSIDVFRVYLEPGESSEVVKGRILARFENQRRLFVLLNREVKDFISDVTDQWFGLTYVQLGVAVLVAVLGIVNTLTVSITDRRRELGVLRAVGGLRNQIRGTVWIEAMTIGAIGLALGLLLGAATLFYELEMVKRDFSGMPLDYIYPVATALALVPVILGVSFVSALAPAESAVRGSLVEALEYE